MGEKVGKGKITVLFPSKIGAGGKEREGRKKYKPTTVELQEFELKGGDDQQKKKKRWRARHSMYGST